MNYAEGLHFSAFHFSSSFGESCQTVFVSHDSILISINLIPNFIQFECVSLHVTFDLP